MNNTRDKEREREWENEQKRERRENWKLADNLIQR